MRQPIQVNIFPVYLDDNSLKFLMFHRAPHATSFWQGVTGGVEDNESLEETVRRELREETAFEDYQLIATGITYSIPVPESMVHLYNPPVETLTEHVFIAILSEKADPVLSPEEHDDFRWCDFDEALSLLHWEKNKQALTKCFEILKNRLCL